ncbi:hypothetical protein C5167_043025 [Papaver somniferum]|uniref:Uncharacterized protein n=1 Tax=Papaver somniferum TaxID=3469 RepID=A0A4Y7L4H7_PAPSO|nr:hypothetical protein C5167_043025 [Papaver somniferum]
MAGHDHQIHGSGTFKEHFLKDRQSTILEISESIKEDTSSVDAIVEISKSIKKDTAICLLGVILCGVGWLVYKSTQKPKPTKKGKEETVLH